MSKPHPDPEYRRWSRKYPRFPGVAKCVELLASPNVRGSWVDIICAELEKHSESDLTELIDAIQAAPDQRVRSILLDVLEVSAPEQAVPILARMLTSEDEEERIHAVETLKRIGTKEARTALFRAGAT